MENEKANREYSLDEVKKIASEYVKKVLEESTNMKTLYHFTTISRLIQIAKTNKLISKSQLASYWDKNNHISLTRHKSNYEGFAKSMQCDVRIELNVEKMLSRHRVLNIKPMEFYSPKRFRGDSLDGEQIDYPNSSKSRYQSDKFYQARKRGNTSIEFQNQAEEGLQMPYSIHGSVPEINELLNLNRFVNRIDIYWDKFADACANYSHYIYRLAELLEISETPFGRYVPIFVYTERNHFALQDNQCMKLSEMIKYFNENICDIRKEDGKRIKSFIDSLKILEENNLEENTNMKTLYHFTNLYRFSRIAEEDTLLSADYCREYWDGKAHVSLTRHKSSLEGYANASFGNEATVRMEFDVNKLNSSHNILNVKPMDYYSPNRERFDVVTGRKIGSGESGKSRYQDKDYYNKKQKVGMGPELKKSDIRRLEYHNQAEEGIQLPFDNRFKRWSDLQNVSHYLNRVDIYWPNLSAVIQGFHNMAVDEEKRWMLEIAKSFFAVDVPIYVYMSKSCFCIQNDRCVALKDIEALIKRNAATYNDTFERVKSSLSESVMDGIVGDAEYEVKKLTTKKELVESCYLFSENFEGYSPQWFYAYLTETGLDVKSSYVAVSSDGKVVGSCVVTNEEFPSEILNKKDVELSTMLLDMDYKCISALAVKPEYRGKSMNYELVTNVINDLVSQGCEWIYIQVLNSLNTHDYWKRYGAIEFLDYGGVKNYMLPISEDAKKMLAIAYQQS